MKYSLLFPGQGAQYIGMGNDLYDSFPEAKKVFDEASVILDRDIKSICFKGPQEELMRTRHAQPAIFVTSIAALEVVKRKLSPEQMAGVAGLSLGEATALVAAGVMDFNTGMAFVRDRGLFMDEASETAPGTMAAVLGIELEVMEKICDACGVEVGNLNCPGQIVISGHHEGIQEAIIQAKASGAKRAMKLDVSGAFHSKCMNTACQRIGKALDRIELKTPKFPAVSNLTALPEFDAAKIKNNLIKQMNHRTLWEESMRFFLNEGVSHFLEIGPGKVLKGLMRKIDPKANVISLGTAEEIEVFLKEKNA